MPFKFNATTGLLDYYEKSNFQGKLAAAPSDPQDGWMYINSGDNKLYIYYEGTWQSLHTLTGIVFVVPSVGMSMGILTGVTYGFDA